jgi:hypothetical protein
MVTKKKVKPIEEETPDFTEGNIANDILCDNEDEEEVLVQQNNIKDVINEISKALFDKYPKKTSNLSNDNIDGMVQAECLNEYMEKNFGYRYSVLDVLVKAKREYVISSGGYGIAAFIESIKSVQATIEQHEIPAQFQRMMNK